MITDEQKSAALARLIPGARAVHAATQCPVEVLIGQALYESCWLTSAPGNNCLGVKHYEFAYGKQLLPTSERFTPAQAASFAAQTDGPRIVSQGPVEADGKMLCQVLDWFATFATLQDCLLWRGERFQRGLSLPWVKEYFLTLDLPQLIYDIAANGYATANPAQYRDGVLAILDDPLTIAALAGS